MIESQQVREWRAQGEAEGRVGGRVQALLRMLELRFPPGTPADLAGRIRATADWEALSRWFNLRETVHDR
jgi:hypothetical protein